jgi:hypothetical protein
MMSFIYIWSYERKKKEEEKRNGINESDGFFFTKKEL